MRADQIEGLKEGDVVRLVPEGSGVSYELGEPVKHISEFKDGEPIVVLTTDGQLRPGYAQCRGGNVLMNWHSMGGELTPIEFYHGTMPPLPAPKEKSLEEKITAAIEDANAGKFYGKTLYNVPKAVRNILALLKAEKDNQ